MIAARASRRSSLLVPSGAVGGSVAPYRWTPPGWPSYSGYTAINYTTTNTTSRDSTTDNTGLGQSQTTDYVITGTAKRSMLRIRGARNVHIRKGHWDVTQASTAGATITARAIELQYITGVCCIENAILEHSAGATAPEVQGDAIYITNSPNATIILLGCHVPMIYGQFNRSATTPNGDHGDVFQSYDPGTTNGVGAIYVDYLTAKTAYQGFGIFNAGINAVDLNHLDIGYSNSVNASVDPDAPTGGGLFQFHGSTGTPPLYRVGDGVLIREARTGSLANTFMPNASGSWSAMNGSVPAVGARYTNTEMTDTSAAGGVLWDPSAPEWQPAASTGLAGPLPEDVGSTHRGYS